MSDERLETVPCPYCWGVIVVGAKRCKYCQVDLAGLWPKEVADREPTKNPLLATALSIIFPGLGQYYCGRNDKAAMFVFAFVFFVGLFYWLTFPWFLVAAWAGVDAFREASRTK